MSLQSELDGQWAVLRRKLPTGAVEGLDAAYRELGTPGRFRHALRVGDRLPAFELPNAAGQWVSLADLLGDGPLVLSFYRGAWCPFCNLQLRALQRVLPELERRGAALAAVSPEKPEFALPLIEREQLAFEVLTDAGNRLARRLGLVFTLEGELRRITAEVLGVDLPRRNGGDGWELPLPATYVVGQDGLVRLASVDPDFRRRMEPGDLLRALDRR